MKIGPYAIAAAFFLMLGKSALAQPEKIPATWNVPSNAEIHKILVDRVDRDKRAVGIVVGVIDPKGQRIVSYGVLNQGDHRPLNGDTVFEIDSITKVFTSLILADMVEKGEVSLGDPVAKYLPAVVKVPQRDGKKITLIDLSTHTSGLPGVPTNYDPKDPANPYANYTEDRLYAFLDSYTLPRDPGAQYEYSNLNGGLLGLALSHRAGVDYGALVRDRVTKPLGMADTVVTISPNMSRRLAVGHNSNLQPVENWDFGALAGAGALRSTANDLLKFLRAEIGGDTPLKAAMVRQLSVHRRSDIPTVSRALGWAVEETPQGNVIQHNGGSFGYRSFIAFMPTTRTGVVVLVNTSGVGGDDIGMHVLTGAPLETSPVYKQIAMDTKAKQAFMGVYQVKPNLIVTITLDGDQLYGQAASNVFGPAWMGQTGQPKAPLFPESTTQLFDRGDDAVMSFVRGPDGRLMSFTLHQRGNDTTANRID